MSVDVKICGIKDTTALETAVSGGARYVGFVFYPKSPRYVSIETAAALAARLPEHVVSVGLMVDPTDEQVRAVLRGVPLGALQLHGGETPERVASLKTQTGLTMIKACGIADQSDIAHALSYQSVADMLLLDAKPAPDAASPGGNAMVFDWDLVRSAPWHRPWMLAGGLHAGNVVEAVRRSGARIVDVSSGVEDAPGQKSPAKIHEFLSAAHGIETSY